MAVLNGASAQGPSRQWRPGKWLIRVVMVATLLAAGAVGYRYTWGTTKTEVPMTLEELGTHLNRMATDDKRLKENFQQQTKELTTAKEEAAAAKKKVADLKEAIQTFVKE